MIPKTWVRQWPGLLVAVICGCSGSVSADNTTLPVKSVEVRPSAVTVLVGGRVQLTATPKDADGNPLTDRAVGWRSSDADVATVTNDGLVRVVAVGPATITATAEEESGIAVVTGTDVPPAVGGEPVFDPSNPSHVLHVFEDWSTYASPSQIGTTNRVDGGGPWTYNGASYQTFSTSNNDPWFGQKTVSIDFQDAPNPVHQRGFVLTRDDAKSPARYLNASSAQASLVIEWAVRQSGTAFYTGKIADWQPTGATNRYNFQNSYDPMGQQGSNTPAGCAADDLCAKYYLSNGDPRTIPERPAIPELGVFGYQFARAYSGSMGTCGSNCVYFYPQNINWGTGAGQYQNLQTSPLVGTPDNVWWRIIIQLTLPQSGQSHGNGRIEQWIQRAGGTAVKVMDYVGDVGGFDQGRVYVGPSGQAWLPDGATMNWYDLTAVLGNFNGGNTTHLGYFRMWSHPRT